MQQQHLRRLTATAAAQTLAAAEPSAAAPFAVRPPGAVRPLNVSKERLSLKAQVIFESSWKKIEEKYKERLVCPREVVWLNGAPGSGKGTNMPFIMKSRGLSRAIGMSQLLDTSPEIKHIIDRGELVPDHMVLDALLEVILNPETNDGAGLVIDGFPRTALQVDFVKLLHDKLMALGLQHADTPEEPTLHAPTHPQVVILYVDEEESVRRQMRRAQLAAMHNKRVMDAGTGDVWDVRTTDVNEALCRRRYQVFKVRGRFHRPLPARCLLQFISAHYHTILRLKSFFPFSLIDAMGTLEEARQQIMRELRYQSSLDLDEATYAAIRHLPLARDLVRVARQRLVFRLDAYCKRDNTLFGDVIRLIDAEVIPVLKQSSLAGAAEFRTQTPLLSRHPHAVDIMIDVLSDRGFSVGHTLEERLVPQSVDLATGDIRLRTDHVHGEDVAIGATFIPKHMVREEGNRLAESRVWSPVKTKRQDAAAMVAATAAAGDEEEEAGGGGGGGHGAGSVPAAVTSRSSAPSGLSQVSTPVQAVQRRQRQQQRKQALSGAELEAYDQASASLGSAQRQEAQASRGGPVRASKSGEEESAYLRSYLQRGPNSADLGEGECEESAAAKRHREYELLDQYGALLEAMNERED
ncbi:hypothetical protein CHLNCDRAFT_137842 [Chlorella variabilis]|uniref:adenylate kinase n=1 Tax=Chlorella variabilis TaxID=554065 RepID=E1Z4M3_CHLVA|nr:hypothetical protein CHLNCDRAFT_137842 [Chlorella variabilis]EFN59083.1 hypothetical protein CHLNCDRAFT_137842 [Chlorella variabilis]|eukprot:XP_005851185.1 hypothetical protein CHLNCDRAFT_137842 [Chlorella variabilis]